MSAKSNREALRKLSRKVPSSPEMKEIVSGLTRENDRSAAIVGAALLEHALEELLAAKFPTKEPNLVAQIFLNQGPLSTFHSKVLISRAMGLISASQTEDLHSIKAIRNVFAHAKVPISFEHELVDKEAGSLNLMKEFHKRAARDNARLEGPNRGAFLITVGYLLKILAAITELLKKGLVVSDPDTVISYMLQDLDFSKDEPSP